MIGDVFTQLGYACKMLYILMSIYIMWLWNLELIEKDRKGGERVIALAIKYDFHDDWESLRTRKGKWEEKKNKK